jgi:hypothetical protein
MKTTTPAAAAAGPLDAALRSAVLSCGLSPNALAIKAGVPVPVLSRWLAGSRRSITLITAGRLARVLNLELTRQDPR